MNASTFSSNGALVAFSANTRDTRLGDTFSCSAHSSAVMRASASAARNRDLRASAGESTLEATELSSSVMKRNLFAFHAASSPNYRRNVAKTQLTAAQEFGRRLAQERRHKAFVEARDIGQRDVAQAVDVSESTLSRWEAGEVMPRDDTLLKLARFFGVTPAWLRYGQEPRTNAPPANIPVEDNDKPLETGRGATPPASKQAAGGGRRRGN